MMKLESIVPGSRPRWKSWRPAPTEPTKGPEGLGERILYRDDEPRLREVSPGRRYAFDGDGHDFPGVAGA